MEESTDASRDANTPADTEANAACRTKRFPLTPWVLFLAFFAIYSANLDYLLVPDELPNTFLPLRMLNAGEPTFTAESHPFMFLWSNENDGGHNQKVSRWTPELRRQYADGSLKPAKPLYFLLESTTPGRYVNIYGMGTALTALPVYAVANWCISNLDDNFPLVLFLGREIAAALVALSAVFLYLAALALTERRNALMVAVAYGLGTCVWSTCSQGLWQQTPTVFYLALGTCLFVRAERTPWLGAPCGMAWAMAVWCRPTSAIVVLCAGVYLALRDRRAFAAYALGGLPFALVLALYNYRYVGSPFSFGQGEACRDAAIAMTGSPSLWQTPLADGLAGLLVSPSRGMFVYSPFLLFAVPGMIRVWTAPKYAVLRPLSAAALLILCMVSKYFAWWGGGSYGYRLVLDITVFLALMLIPLADVPKKGIVLPGLFAAALAWSAAVQIIGVTVYDLGGWNNRRATAVFTSDHPDEPRVVLEERDVEALRKTPSFVKEMPVNLDIDMPLFHGRLWSVTDSPLVYYATHLGKARQQRSVYSGRFAADYLDAFLNKSKK